MVAMRIDSLSTRTQVGTSLIEVLVAMVVLAIGLLGLVGLQARLNILQIESYQRAQAMTILNDMVARMSLNRNATTSAAASDNYITTTPLGTGMVCPTNVSTRKNADLAQWCSALQGAAETNGGNVGAMAGARGCIEVFNAGDQEYRVTVAWQGMAPLAAPPASIACGAGLYGANGTACAGDVCRRVVTTIVRISDLT